MKEDELMEMYYNFIRTQYVAWAMIAHDSVHDEADAKGMAEFMMKGAKDEIEKLHNKGYNFR